MFKRIILVAAGVFLLLMFLGACFTGGFLLGRQIGAEEERARNPLGLVQEAMEEIQRTYLEKIPTRRLIKGAIEGMVESLNDPYTRYLDRSHFKMFKEETAGRFEGVGIMIGIEDNQLTVISPLEDTPAARAGIQAGDKIIKIDDKSTKNMVLDKAVQLIRGKMGTIVVLTISREGVDQPLKFELRREKINIPNVSSKMLEDKLGYIRIHYFTGKTSPNLKNTLNKLKGNGALGVILDLRNNPGGLLDESINVASVFIESGPIVKVKSRTGELETHDAKGGADEEIPLVVLVNRGSASASEIVAGAIKERKRGVIVGEKTFGKGSVQTIVTLSDGSGLVITTATYLTPGGVSIHKEGIKPDVEVVVPMERGKLLTEEDKQLEKAKEILKSIISGKDVRKAA